MDDKTLKNIEEEIENLFTKASSIFESQKRYDLASKCYSSLGKFDKALELALKGSNSEMKADLLFMKEDFDKAFQFYKSIGKEDMEIRTLAEMCKAEPEFYDKLLYKMVDKLKNMNQEEYEGFKPFFKAVLKNFFSHLESQMLLKREDEKIKAEQQADLTSFKELTLEAADSFEQIQSEIDDNVSSNESEFKIIKSDLVDSDKFSE